MRRPFYRSITLWLGLPGFLFLIWLWVGSREYANVAFIDWPGRDNGIGSDRDGFVFLTRETELSRATDWSSYRSKNTSLYYAKGDYARISLPSHALWLAPWEMESMEELPGDVHQFLRIRSGFQRRVSNSGEATMILRVPFPVMLGLYGAAWGTAFAWRSQRRKKAAASFKPPRRGDGS